MNWRASKGSSVAVALAGLLGALLSTPLGAQDLAGRRGAAAFATAPYKLGAHLLPEPTMAVPDEVDHRAALRDYLNRLRPLALHAGVRAQTFDAATNGLSPYAPVLARTASQPELVRTTQSYISALVSDQRIASGREAMSRVAASLAQIEAAYGVPGPVLMAIWGIETLYGARRGDVPTIQALATLASAGGRRQRFWQEQLIGALKVLDRGDVSPEAMVGSWAGAMGHTQMIPTTYLAHAVDFDRDGRRNVWTSEIDALASAAHYLKASGWRSGLPWGFEVKLPARFDFALGERGRGAAREVWEFMGLSRPDGTRLPEVAGTLELILPAGVEGPAFLVTRNYRAFLAYNNAMSYALAVGLLADRIAGFPPVVTAWPIEAVALSHDERREVQTLLHRAGYDPGGIDGVLGTGTRSAIRAFQKVAGRPADGHPDRGLLLHLRSVASSNTGSISAEPARPGGSQP